METQKTPNIQSTPLGRRMELEESTFLTSDYTILHSYSTVPAQRQKYRSMEQNRKSGDKSIHGHRTFGRGGKKCTMEKRQSLQQVVLGKLINLM